MKHSRKKIETEVPRIIECDISSLGSNYKDSRLELIEHLFGDEYSDFSMLSRNDTLGNYLAEAVEKSTGEKRVIKAFMPYSRKPENEVGRYRVAFVREAQITRDFGAIMPGRVPEVRGIGVKDARSYRNHRMFYPEVPYFVMSYIPGEDLFSIKNGKLEDLDMKGRIFADVAETIALTHSEGFVHRDIKPNNIILREGEEPRPVVADFGAATPMYSIDEVAGTKLYIAPAQIAAVCGKRKLTPQEIAKIDMNPFGHVMQEIATGKHRDEDYRDLDWDTYLRFIAETRDHDIELQPTGNKPLNDVIFRCLTHGKDSYTSMMDVANDLNTIFRKSPLFFLLG
jgi:serine/threonine protein kinase